MMDFLNWVKVGRPTLNISSIVLGAGPWSESKGGAEHRDARINS